MLDDLERKFADGLYPDIIESLMQSQHLLAREHALLGISLLRTYQFEAAEIPLGIAMAQGDLEAAVEYGNWLRVMLKLRQAKQHFEKILPSLEGELRFRALRWLGLIQTQLGDVSGRELVEEARLGYLTLGNLSMAARLSTTLAIVHFATGELERALVLLEAAIPVLKQAPNPRPLLTAYNNVIDTHINMSNYDKALALIDEVMPLALSLPEPAYQLQVKARRTSIKLFKKESVFPEEELQMLRREAELVNESNVYRYATSELANHLSRSGHHAQALRMFAELSAKTRTEEPEQIYMGALLLMRRGQCQKAKDQLLALQKMLVEKGSYLDANRALLMAANCAFLMGDMAEVKVILTDVMHEFAGTPLKWVRSIVDFHWEDVNSMLEAARSDPELELLVRAAFGEAEMTESMTDAHDVEVAGMTSPYLVLRTLGERPAAVFNGQELSLGVYSVGVLVYLALHPGRTRAQITADLWPDEAAKLVADRFRHVVLQIRKLTFQEAIQLTGSHQMPVYALDERVTVQLDVLQVLELLSSEQLDEALRLYQGSFLAALPASDWITEQRDRLVMALKYSLEIKLREAEACGDHAQYLALAEQMLRIDPDDFEIEAQRLAYAKERLSPVELARIHAENKRRWG